jgi:hypothetical protein
MNKLMKLSLIAGVASVIAFAAFGQVTTGDPKGENSPSSSGLSNKSRGAPGIPQGSNAGTGKSSNAAATKHRHHRHRSAHGSSAK